MTEPPSEPPRLNISDLLTDAPPVRFSSLNQLQKSTSSLRVHGCVYPSVAAVVFPGQAVCAGLDLKLSNPVIRWWAALNDDPCDLLQLTHVHLNPGVCWNVRQKTQRILFFSSNTWTILWVILWLVQILSRQTRSGGHPARVPVQSSFIWTFPTKRRWCREHWISDVSVLHTQPSHTHWK